MKYQLEISATAGYSPNQVNGITVGELIDMLRDFNEDDEIILHDASNRYGASFGTLSTEYTECEEE